MRKKMKAEICDRCKNVFTVSNCVEVIVAKGTTHQRRFDLCRDCKKWLYKELGVKEEREKKV